MKFLSPILFLVIILFSKNGIAQTLTVSPNPFIQSAILQFNLSTSDTTSLYIVNIWGSVVKTVLHDTVLSPANYSYTVSGDSFSAGSYIVVLQRNGQRTSTRLIKASSVTAIIETKPATWDLYPNPAKNRIIFDKTFIGSEIIITDISGKEYSAVIDQNQIDISGLARGSYILRFKFKGSVTDKKFIKE